MGAPVVALARRVRVLEEALEGVPVEVLAAREGVRARSVRRWIENAGLMVAWGKIVAMPVDTTDTAPETLT
ncbi:helix-turn-helix domain-containing protein, partial [Kocuria sp. CPCC 104605]|uniref:helix-turn-helix domain-containing protein n=1 Tax=Kocuria sp. CPCC 104605 TaxID=2282476 RepID=UPI001E509D10